MLHNALRMSDQQPMLASSFSGSYLEESGIYLGTKQNKPNTHSVKPPRIVSRAFTSTPLYHTPKCVAGFGYFPSGFPSPLYDRRCDQSYLNQCFDVIHKIGEGSFGLVWKVRSKEDQNMYAVKVCKEPFKNRAHRTSLLEEVRRHEQLSKHPNIVTLHQAWEDEGYLYTLLELCKSSLDAYTEAHHDISESMVWDILVDMISAVEYIHGQNLIHMDIKLENILLATDGTYKLSDFGLVLDAEKASGNKEALEGDPKYLAPEVMDGHFTQAADMFSLGIAVLEVAGDLVLPHGGDAWHHLRQGKIPHLQTAKLSSHLIEIIVGMMDPDPFTRLTATQILRLPLIHRKRIARKHRNVSRKVKVLARKLYSTVLYPFRKLLLLWRRLKDCIYGRSAFNNNNNKFTDSPRQSPYMDGYGGIGQLTPIRSVDVSDIINLSHRRFTFSNSNVASIQKNNFLNKKRGFVRRKLHLSDSE